ncbi:MAG: Ppx/GppA phosphatase family protein [Pseudomonadota bacterium]
MGEGTRNGEHSPRAGNRIENRGARRRQTRLAALDLGTNNCRLLIASPRGRHFRIIDAFSRIVRLGEGMSRTGALSPDAMARAIEAIKVCADKIERRGVTHGRYIATQACRAAANGEEFLERVNSETGLEFEVITTAEEARLAVSGCTDLFDPEADAAMIFDIGGGSTEVSWVRPKEASDGAARSNGAIRPLEIVSWFSLPVGVVTLSEKWGGRELDEATYEEVVESIREEVRAFGDPGGVRSAFDSGAAHLLGTSGTVTSIAGVHLDLQRYRRDAVDGLWLSTQEARDVSARLLAMDFNARAAQPCIGRERADLVVCGCAILEALLREWPSSRIRVADRGLREGVLAGLAEKARRKRRRRRKRKPRSGDAKRGE